MENQIVEEEAVVEPVKKLSWAKRNPEKHAEHCRAWQRKNKSKTKQYCDNWKSKNKDKYNEYHKVYQKAYNHKKKQLKEQPTDIETQ